MPTIDDAQTRDAWLPLTWAGMFFALTVLLHNSDHIRRGLDTSPTDVFVVGTLALFVEVGVVALIAWRHRLAPLASVAAGATLAAGYIFVHFLPSRSWLSDSFTSNAGTSWMSWAAASGEVAGALLLVIVGATALRARTSSASESTQVAPDSAPRVVAVAFAASQLITLVVSLVQFT